MSNVKKTLQMTSLIFGMAILFCYIGWCLGYDGFIIVGHIDMPLWSLRIIKPLLLTINWSLQMCFVLKLYSWKILYFSAPIAIIGEIAAPWLPPILFTGFIPTFVLIVAIIIKKLGKDGFLRLFGSTIAILIYQWLASQFTTVPLDTTISTYQMFRLSINTILINLLLYSMGGAKYYGRLESVVFPGSTRDDQSRNDGRQGDSEVPDDLPVDKFERWIMRSVITLVQVIQWMFILWVCSLDNLFLDALVMTTSFICYGRIISRRKHLKPIIFCTLASTAMFYFSARFTLSFRYSQLFPIMIGLALVYTLYQVSYQFEETAKSKSIKDRERIEALERQISNLWDEFDELY